MVRRRLVALLLGCGLGLVAAEGLARWLDLAPEPWVRHQHLERADKRAGVDLYPDDPYGVFPLDLAIAEDLAQVRAAGLSPDEESVVHTPRAVLGTYDEGLCREERPPAPATVLVVGDSFTEGQGVEQQAAWPRQLEGHLGTRVANCGRRGFDVEDAAAFLERQLARHDPSWVLYGMLPNDPVQSEAYAARQRYLDDWIVLRSRTVQAPVGVFWWSSELWRWSQQQAEARRLGRATEAWYAGMAGPDNATGWQATLDRIEGMAQASDEDGARFGVVLWPILARLKAYPFAELHRRVVRDLGARGIDVLDLTPALRDLEHDELWVHPMDHHPAPKAHAVAAEAVANWLTGGL